RIPSSRNVAGLALTPCAGQRLKLEYGAPRLMQSHVGFTPMHTVSFTGPIVISGFAPQFAQQPVSSGTVTSPASAPAAGCATDSAPTNAEVSGMVHEQPASISRAAASIRAAKSS